MLELAKKMCDTVMEEHKPIISSRWAYDSGFVLKGFERVYRYTNDKRYFDYIKAYIDHFINDDGTINDCKTEDYNLDNINCGKNLLFLYVETKDSIYKTAVEYLMKQLKSQPKTKSGVYWHKNIYPHQIWLDGLFMAEPFCAEYAVLNSKEEMFDCIMHQFVEAEKATYDSGKRLYKHAYDESRSMYWADKVTGRSENVWGRAMGWYVTAVVDVLDFIPIEYHGVLTDILNKMMCALIPYQTEEGVWKQVIDSKDERNYNEASCSAMFGYALIKGIKNGYLDKNEFFDSARRAREGFLSEFVREDEKYVYVDNICKVAGLGGNTRRDGSFEYYMSEPVVTNDFKGIGAFLALCLEWYEFDKIN